MKRLIYLIFIGLLTLSMTYCSPEDGDIGPQGPQGISGEHGQDGQDGQDGVDGQDGQDGEDGEDGNANVESTGWITIDNWTNSYSGVGNTDFYEYGDIDIIYSDNPSANGFNINADNIDGIVLLYIKNDKGVKLADHYKERVYEGGQNIVIEYRYIFYRQSDTSGSVYPIIGLKNESVDNNWDADFMMDTYLPQVEFMMVFVPPTTYTNNINFKDYEKVNRLLKLDR